MELALPERQALARLLSDRLPGYAERSQVALAAGVAGSAQLSGNPQSVWEDIVERAADAENIPTLLRAAAAARPGDRRLQRAAAQAAQGKLALRDPLHWILFVVAAAGAVGVFLLLRPMLIAAPASALSAPRDAPLSAGVLSPDIAPNAPVANTDSPSPAEFVAQLDEGDDLLTAATPAKEGRCQAAAGAVVGWWYTRQLPRKGEIYTLDRSINVRRVPPNEANHWSSRAPVICVLRPKDRVRVSGDPVPVGSGYWWVPLQGGDLNPDF